MLNTYIWIVAALAIAGVIIRPLKIAEAFWAVAGAAVLLIFQLISFEEGWHGIAKGTDVYLFLTGMMLLAETAREEKLFDWLAAYATRLSKGSQKRLFLLIYLAGIIVTAFLSNDATAVVLTPAVAAAVKAAKVDKPLPYLLICAFIANAASFILPISNPANLVIYGSHLPPLGIWLAHYTIPAVVAVTVTYILLYLTQQKQLTSKIEPDISIPNLTAGSKTALIGIAVTAVVLLVSSALGIALGLPTAVTGVITSAIVVLNAQKNPVKIIKGVSWAVLPLVAGLFVIVEALTKTGLTQHLNKLLGNTLQQTETGAVWISGVTVAFACNLMNNLPAGLIAGNVIQSHHLPELVKSSVLIGVDVGPNLSVTGSLATILWLVALRRENQTCSAWAFLKLGALIMTVTLLCTIASLFIF